MRPAVTAVKLSDGAETHWPVEANDDNFIGQAGFLRIRMVSRSVRRPGTHVAHRHALGFRTVIERFQDENLTVIVLSNRTDLDVEKLALAAAAAVKK